MIISAQALAAYLEQDATAWSSVQRARAEAHIRTAGDEVRGALATLYTIPTYTRATDGSITSPAGATDPERTALGPIVKQLAAAFLLNPSRGIQPQEDRTAATEYRAAAMKQLKALQTGAAFIAPLSSLTTFGITYTDALSAMLRSRTSKSAPLLRQMTAGYFGPLSNPDGGGDLEPT